MTPPNIAQSTAVTRGPRTRLEGAFIALVVVVGLLAVAGWIGAVVLGVRVSTGSAKPNSPEAVVRGFAAALRANSQSRIESLTCVRADLDTAGLVGHVHGVDRHGAVTVTGTTAVARLIVHADVSGTLPPGPNGQPTPITKQFPVPAVLQLARVDHEWCAAVFTAQLPAF